MQSTSWVDKDVVKNPQFYLQMPTRCLSYVGSRRLWDFFDHLNFIENLENILSFRFDRLNYSPPPSSYRDLELLMENFDTVEITL